MGKLALALSVLSLPLLGGSDPDLTRLLQGIEQRYNRAKSLQVQFNEAYSVQGTGRRNESGTLTLRKPGRMRWDYASPAGKVFLSDGKTVYLYTPKDKRVERMKLKESEDMRAPLAFLLGKLDFSKEFRDFSWKADGVNYRISAKANNDRLPYESVEMLVTPSFQIQQLAVMNTDQSVLAFTFGGEKLNPPVDDAIFRFQMPAGARFAEAEGSN